MRHHQSFVERALRTKVASSKQIEAAVEAWHRSESTELSLSEWLGFTQEEYKLWALRPSLLPFILSARKSGIPIEALVASVAAMQQFHQFSNLAPEKPQVQSHLRWLQRRGRLKIQIRFMPSSKKRTAR